MKVLIVVDMQNDFIDGSLGTKEAVGIVDRVAEVMDSFDGAVICTRDTHFADYLETSEGRKLPVEHCIEGTKGHALQDTIQKMAEKRQAVVMNKITFGAKNLPEEIEKLAGGVPEFIELSGTLHRHLRDFQCHAAESILSGSADFCRCIRVRRRNAAES